MTSASRVDADAYNAQASALHARIQQISEITAVMAKAGAAHEGNPRFDKLEAERLEKQAIAAAHVREALRLMHEMGIRLPE